MVCGKNIHRLPQGDIKHSLSNGYHLRHDVFEHAEAAKRLGQVILMSARPCTP
jgi:hypothetical protein